MKDVKETVNTMTDVKTIGLHLLYEYQFPFDPLFLTMSGSHGFGMSSPHSDYDVTGCHVLPLEQVLGFSEEKNDTWTAITDVRTKNASYEVELVTHDIKKFLYLLRKGNGNALESLYSPLVIKSNSFHDELMDIAKGCISKQCAFHYRGMAFNQQKNLASHEVKKYLHILRCLQMGIYLMETGTILMHVPTLMEMYAPGARDLIEWKKAGLDSVPDSCKPYYERLIPQLHTELEKAKERSSLPERTSQKTAQTLENFLIWTRLDQKSTMKH